MDEVNHVGFNNFTPARLQEDRSIDNIDVVDISSGSDTDEVEIVFPRAVRDRSVAANGVGKVTKRRKIRSEGQISAPSASTNLGSLHNTNLLRKLVKKLRCSICLDEINRITSTTCGHVFCRDCIIPCVRSTNKCPLCQKNLTMKDFHDLFL